MVKYAVRCSIKLIFLPGLGIKVCIFAPHRGLFYGLYSFEAVLCCCGFSSGKRSLPTSRFVRIRNEGCGWQRKNARLRFHRYNSRCHTHTPAERASFRSLFNGTLLQQEDERLQGRQGGLELPGLQGREASWTQERAALQQEVRLFRRNTVIFYMKLRSMLMRRRLGCKDQEETAQPEVSPLVLT